MAILTSTESTWGSPHNAQDTLPSEYLRIPVHSIGLLERDCVVLTDTASNQSHSDLSDLILDLGSYAQRTAVCSVWSLWRILWPRGARASAAILRFSS